MRITKDIVQVGVKDRAIDLFEGQYAVPEGVAYNSYVLLDEKTAVFDTVDEGFCEEWLANVDEALQGVAPNYLIVQHMEPDHSANIVAFMRKYPKAVIVASAKAFAMMKNYFGEEFEDRRLVAAEGTELSLGAHTLVFIAAPMVHWPEVLVTYDRTSKTLFSADGFGKFGTTDSEEDWTDEARRYYIGIVGKYGVQVQNLLKKAATLKIERICPLHGPVLQTNLSKYLALYDTWSAYRAEEDGVLIAYTSVYGHTKSAVDLLAATLRGKGKTVVVNDLARCDRAETLANAFRYGTVVLATTTYNGEIFPFMREFLSDLKEYNFQNRKVAFMENGSWAPTAARVMRGMLETCKDLRFAQTTVRILSAVNADNQKEIAALAEELVHSETEKKEESNMAKYTCNVCGWTYDEEKGLPEKGIAPGTKFEDLPSDFQCEICGMPKSEFTKEA